MDEVSLSRKYAEIIADLAIEMQQHQFPTEEQYRKHALNTIRGNYMIPAYRVYDIFGTFLKLHPYGNQHDQAEESVVEHTIDKIKHPKHGELTWDSEQGMYVIKRKGSVVFTGTKQQVAQRWKAIKSSLYKSPTSQVREQSVSTITHPKYGELVLDRVGEMYVIKRGYQVMYRGSKEAVMKKWAQVKQSSNKYMQETTADSQLSQSTRKIEKPEGADFSWVSSFDIKEVNKAIEGIVEYLASDSDDRTQTHVLRNDIRILDNLASALKSGDALKIEQCWEIARDQGVCEHLHEEFCDKMDQAIGGLAPSAKRYESGVYESLHEWKQGCAIRRLRLQESEGFVTAVDPSGALAGGWMQKTGWILAEGWDDPNYRIGWMVSAIGDLHANHAKSEMKDVLAKQGWGKHPDFEQEFEQAYNKFYGIEPDEEDEDDYTDYSMRQGEMGRHGQYESVTEDAPPGQEQWIQSNKASFIKQYGKKRGTEVLYATAWKRYNKTNK